MEKEFSLPIIKSSPKESLKECLIGLKKDQLMGIAKQHNIQLKKSLTKSIMIEELMPVIKKEFAEKDSQQFDQIKVTNTISSPDELSPDEGKAVQKGYLYLFQKKNSINLLFPKELKIEEQAALSVGSFEKSKENFKRIFGYTDLEFLNDAWKR
ncbi:MAG: hypothetical protein L0K82_01745 [Pisciglobus halotolerans]|nr:hypothetical protein [Pisciglobus halotolerans]